MPILPGPPRRWLLVLLLCATAAPGGWLPPEARESGAILPPVLPAPSAYSVLIDRAPVDLTVTAAWHRIPLRVTVHDLRTDPTLWRRMHFTDWDRLGLPLREEGLDRMIARYGSLATDSTPWPLMDAAAWDAVPQPIRAMAFIRMVEYWTGHLEVGSAYPLDRRALADTLGAIVMVESWFEHRAVFRNRAGEADVGLAQASPFARERLRERHRAGRAPFALADEDYFNPWLATRFAALWFDWMLGEAQGDLDLAIRAYNRGIAPARRGHGGAYLAAVTQQRERFIRNTDAPPSWDYLSRRLRPGLSARDHLPDAAPLD